MSDHFCDSRPPYIGEKVVETSFSNCWLLPPPWRSHTGDIEIMGVRASVRPSVTKLVSVITSDFMHGFTQYLT